MKKALKLKGKTDYLGDGLRCSVRRNFIHCDNGVRLEIDQN